MNSLLNYLVWKDYLFLYRMVLKLLTLSNIKIQLKNNISNIFLNLFEFIILKIFFIIYFENNLFIVNCFFNVN